MGDPVSIDKGMHTKGHLGSLRTSQQASLEKWSLQVVEVLLAPGSLLTQSLSLYLSNALDCFDSF